MFLDASGIDPFFSTKKVVKQDNLPTSHHQHIFKNNKNNISFQKVPKKWC